MSYKGYIYSRCRRKARHATKPEAQREVDKMIAGGRGEKGNLRAYHCDSCLGWHVGSLRCSLKGDKKVKAIIRTGSVLLAGQ